MKYNIQLPLKPQKVLKALYIGAQTGHFQPLHISHLPGEHYREVVITNDMSL